MAIGYDKNGRISGDPPLALLGALFWAEVEKVHIFIEIIIIVQIQEEWATNQEENQLPLDKVLNCNAGRHFVFANITLDCLMWVILCFAEEK